MLSQEAKLAQHRCLPQNTQEFDSISSVAQADGCSLARQDEPTPGAFWHLCSQPANLTPLLLQRVKEDEPLALSSTSFVP